MNKKGITLVELLAVLVLLSIIAVIAVPLTLNLIKDSKNDADAINKSNIILYKFSKFIYIFYKGTKVK